MTLIDITPLIDESLAIWPGDTPYARTVNTHMADGANLTLSDIRGTVHLGASADAPSHYVKDGEDIASRSLDSYIGPCVVLHVDGARGRRITPDDIRDKQITATRVLFRTGTYDSRKWAEDFASLSPELVDHLHGMGVITIGMDTPSIDPFESKALEAHQACARHDMSILEGLALDGVAEGRYELIALPLRLKGADGSPVRAVLRTI